VVFVVGWLLKAPDETVRRASGAEQTAAQPKDYTPTEMLRSPPFWVMYLMFVLTATGGLIVTAQLKPVAQDLGLDEAHASLIGFSVMALPFALSMSRVLNGVSRPFFGWISDHLGRERTMFLAFTLKALSFLLFSRVGTNPTAFVVVSCLVFFAYGEI